MKRLIALSLLGFAALGAAPATAADCTGQKVAVACDQGDCSPDHCNIDICVVWYSGRCLVG